MVQRKTNTKNIKASEKTGNREIRLIITAAVVLFFELCLFNIFGKVGGWIRYAEFGLFGLAASIPPLMVFTVVI